MAWAPIIAYAVAYDMWATGRHRPTLCGFARSQLTGDATGPLAVGLLAAFLFHLGKPPTGRP